MALLSSLIALLGRFAGRLVSATLGWATVLLFGRVEAGAQSVLTYVTLVSLAWVAALVGVLVPDVGSMLIAFVPLPEFIDERWARLGMLGLALLLPAVIGVAIAMVQDRSRPTGRDLAVAIVRGYPFTLLLAFLIAFLAVVALTRRLRSLSRRWEDAHVPVIVKPGRYDEVVSDLRDVLDQAGLAVEMRDAPRTLTLPPKLLDLVAGRALGSMVPDRLALLVGDALEILVYPSDVAIAGIKEKVAAARAAVAQRLTWSPAHLTVDAEAQRMEDRIRAVARAREAGANPAELLAQVRQIDSDLATLAVPFDEWETLYRQRLQVERELTPRAPTLALPKTDRPQPVSKRSTAREVAAAVGVMALFAVDAVLLMTQGRRTERDAPRSRLPDLRLPRLPF
jgi:hypothetical protein